jgi:hypothetical protein
MKPARLYFFVFISLSFNSVANCATNNATYTYESMKEMLFRDKRANDTTNEYKLIVPLHKFGFANRMRTLASFVYLSKLLNRKLYISWKKTPECYIPMQQIFKFTRPDSNNDMRNYYYHENYFAVFTEQQTKDGRVNNATDQLLDAFVSLHTSKKVNDANIFYKSLSGFDLDITVYKSLTQNILILTHDGWYIPNIAMDHEINIKHGTSISCRDFFIFKKHFYNSLILSSEIQNNVNQIWNHLKGKLFVGVHVRKTDKRHDWPTVASKNPREYLNFDDVTSNEQYINVMKKIVTKFPNVYFYIASNNNVSKMFFKVQAEHQKKYFDNKFYFLDIPKDGLNRFTMTGMELAIVEFFILSKTELVISTYGSSFGQEASFWTSTPELLLRNGGHIYHENNILLPNCNNDLYASQIANIIEKNVAERQTIKYENGNLIASASTVQATSHRKKESMGLRSFKVQKKLCTSFKNIWGVDGVYCD